ncbi:MAG: hypothetical protein ACRDK8_10660, partial [Solirubrobacteraceae bacterium]
VLREQLAGDHELLNDVRAGREPDDDGALLDGAVSRIMLVEDLSRQLGGLIGDGFASGVLGYPA